MSSSKKQAAFISSIMDLCAEIDRLCGTSLPTRSCREVGLEFHNRGYRDYNDDAPAFIEEIFADRWIWGEGGETKQPELYNAASVSTTRRADGPSRSRLQRLKTCANCGHHISAHEYAPDPEGNTHRGPGPCRVPGCPCTEFVRLEPGERVKHSTTAEVRAMTKRTAREFMYHHAHSLFEGLMQQAEMTLVEGELPEIEYEPEERVGELIDQYDPSGEHRAEIIAYLKDYDLVDLAHDSFAKVHDQVAAEAKQLLASFEASYEKAASNFVAQLEIEGEDRDKIYELLTSDDGVMDFCMSNADMGAGASFADRYPWDELSELGVSFDTFRPFVRAERPKYAQPLFDEAGELGLLALPKLVEEVVNEVLADAAEGEPAPVGASARRKTYKASYLPQPSRRVAFRRWVVEVYADPSNTDLEYNEWQDLCTQLFTALNRRIVQDDAHTDDGFQESNDPGKDGYQIKALVDESDAEFVEDLAQRMVRSSRYLGLNASVDAWEA